MAAVRRVCVYCGSAVGRGERFREAATALGTRLAEAQIELVYGGGRIGLMGVVADAVLAGGGRVTGIIPALLHDRELAHTGIRLEIVASMHQRKQRMFDLSDAFVVLPGGLGTLDETIEIVTWRQLGLHEKPVVVLDVEGYWAPLRALVEHAIAQGFAPERASGFLHFVPEVDAVLPTLASLPEPMKAADGRLT